MISKDKLKEIQLINDRGVTFPKGFKAGGCHVGLKKKKKDMTIIYSEQEANWAAVFTKNKVKAAPVLWNESLHNKNGTISAIVINSGNANACTGEKGVIHTEMMAEKTAQILGLYKEQVLVASTGVIGVTLPIQQVLQGIEKVSAHISSDDKGCLSAATGIQTTDTFVKQGAIDIQLSNGKVKIGGMAKGSGMIHPNMATMLSFITTDANISSTLLHEILLETTDETYNMISVDGDTSTNDMVLVLANKKSETPEITKNTEDYYKFKEAFKALNKYLAIEIARDGEGAGKLVQVTVNGANTAHDAKLLAKSIVSSNLVKTAIFGEDANWGRILCAMGYSEASFNPESASILFSSSLSVDEDTPCIEVYREGLPLPFSEEKALEILKEPQIHVVVNLKDGSCNSKAWGCDLGYEYIRINGEYRS